MYAAQIITLLEKRIQSENRNFLESHVFIFSEARGIRILNHWRQKLYEARSEDDSDFRNFCHES